MVISSNTLKIFSLESLIKGYLLVAPQLKWSGFNSNNIDETKTITTIIIIIEEAALIHT